jgi:hypothetical protein
MRVGLLVRRDACALALLADGLHTVRNDRRGRAAGLGTACEQEARVTAGALLRGAHGQVVAAYSPPPNCWLNAVRCGLCDRTYRAGYDGTRPDRRRRFKVIDGGRTSHRQVRSGASSHRGTRIR